MSGSRSRSPLDGQAQRAGQTQRAGQAQRAATRPALGHLVSVPTRSGTQAARDISGTSIEKVPTRVKLVVPGRWALLLFLGSRCEACTGFWRTVGAPTALGIERGDRLVVVTRPSGREDAEAVRALLDSSRGGYRVDVDAAHRAIAHRDAALRATAHRDEVAPTLVMSDDAWHHYGVHGPPFFSLVDGVSVVTEGVAWSVDQVRDDVRRRRIPGRAHPPTDGRIEGTPHDGPSSTVTPS